MTSSAVAEKNAFEKMKAELVRKHPGQFAVVCGRRLLGVFATVDDALLSCSRLFDAGILPDGAAMYVSEIADKASLRVTARAFTRPDGRNRLSVTGEIQS